jgi:hypothetical protein
MLDLVNRWLAYLTNLAGYFYMNCKLEESRTKSLLDPESSEEQQILQKEVEEIRGLTYLTK